ncbi:hypothetical protein GCM10010218_13160 [Streptomyces mashuensis]|uniref:Uncharacterized protein n=1 Tax=Streptomyces mashuensis TaxID=33904 RepID=A0A919EBE8_9ACTN|nr:hypothetical protein [Streptomyces mashuensis]GHF33429.1 hypothetical protein GCM10010218_13160 [Streptomyces mashuensis]
MVAVDEATAAELLNRPVTPEDEVKLRIAHLLSRSLADEGIGDDLIDTLEEAIGDRPGPAAPVRKLDAFLIRFGFPVPRQRPPKVAPLSKGDAARIADRFRRATRQLMQVVPHRVSMYPTEELRHLLALRDEQPAPEDALSYLRRYALAILAVLDLMGDDAE